MINVERRFVGVDTAIDGNRLTGYAAVFEQRSNVGPYWEELAPTAFDAALAFSELDVVGLFNHDPSSLLARTPDSLKLSSDTHGLHFEMALIDTAISRDVRAYVDAGLLTGCSFAFVANEQHWDTHQGQDLRVHTSVSRLLDVSVVTYPAYQGTNVSLRMKPTTAAIDGRSQLIRARARMLSKGIN